MTGSGSTSGLGAGSGDRRPAILYLDVDDEITSAAARVRSAPEGAVAIVLPHGSRLATSRINFRLLAREAAERGRRLSIVAPDASTRALAASAGLPVFASVSEFESAAAPGGEPAPAGPPPAEHAPRAEHVPLETFEPPMRIEPSAEPRSRRPGGSIPVVGRRRGPSAPSARAAAALLIVAMVALVGAVGAFVVLPSATIAISPRLETVGPIRLEIVADPDATQADPASGVIPAQRLTIDVAASETFPATGNRVESTKATGSVTFQNCDTGRSKTVGAGAVVSTAGGVKFATSTVVTVPRATIFPFACKTASVGVVAVAEGPDGNVAAATISRVPPGYDSVVLSVTNPAATEGGTSTEFPVVLQEDVDAALDTLIASARSEFIARLADPAETPEGVEVFDETALLGDPVPTVDPASLVGTEVATFELGVTASGSVIAVNTAPIHALAETRLLATIVPPDGLVDGSVEITVGAPVVDGETVRFPATAQASTVRTIDGDALKAEILGLPLRDARAILEAAGVVEIAVWPEWVTAIPGFEARVTLTVGDPVVAP